MDKNLKIENEPKLQDLPLKENPPVQNQISWTWLMLSCLSLGGVMAALTYKQRAGMQWLIFVILFELCFFVFYSSCFCG